MDDDIGGYMGWAIVEFKKDAIQSGVTPKAVVGELSLSMLGAGVGMLRVLTPATAPSFEAEDDEWAPTLIAHIKHVTEARAMEYLARLRRPSKRTAVHGTLPDEETLRAS